MQTGNFRTRRNALGLSSVEGFKNVKGSFRNGCKDVQFLRIVGINRTILTELEAMDRTLTEQMGHGQGFYNRNNALPRLAALEDVEFYSGAYEKWVGGRKQAVSLKTAMQNQQLPNMIGCACVEILGLLGEGKQGMNQSIEKNFIAKVLFWLDETISPALRAWEPERSMKVVFTDISKPQEYLFCYLLTLLGMDVLLLQAKQDISPELERLGLSQKCMVGSLGQHDVPEYRPEKLRNSGNLAGNGSGMELTARIAVDTRVPERDRRTKEMLESRQSRAKEMLESRQGRTKEMPESRQGRTKEMPESRQSRTKEMPESRQGRTKEMPESQRSRRQPAPSSRRELAYEELAQLASSVVQIMIHDERGAIMGGGSGIMVGRAGYILTNNHVACRGRYYSVRIEEDEKVYQTNEMIKYNSVLDLAVIRIDRPLQPLPIYNGQQKLVRGQRVVAIGSPLGLFNSVSDGIISGFRVVEDVDMIQFTAPISNGSSGGAVLNMYGEVIGISTAGFDAGQNINLAVGYEYIRDFVRGFVS